MSVTLEEFIATVHPKAKGAIKGTAKLVVTDLGSVLLSEEGAIESDADADVTLKASVDTFKAILEGKQNPVMAVMSRKLKVDGNEMRALKVSNVLTA